MRVHARAIPHGARLDRRLQPLEAPEQAPARLAEDVKCAGFQQRQPFGARGFHLAEEVADVVKRAFRRDAVERRLRESPHLVQRQQDRVLRNQETARIGRVQIGQAEVRALPQRFEHIQ